MASSSSTSFHAYGDSGLLVECEGGDAEGRWRLAQHLGRELRDRAPTGMVDLVASFASVFISFDPLVVRQEDIEKHVLAAATTSSPVPESRTFHLPVVYGGQHGPDLSQVADLLELSSDALIELHTGQPWVVRLVGSPAGAPLMDGPPMPRSVPRLTSPRSRLPAGSLGISGSQSIIYNAPSPGGWQLIGRTPLRLFDIATPPHVAYRPGDLIQFVPISTGKWDRWSERSLATEEAT